MDSLKYKVKLDYVPSKIPQVDNREIETGLLHSAAPYMPLYDQELGGQMHDHPAYPVPQPPTIARPGQEISYSISSSTEGVSETKEKLKKAKKGLMHTIKSMQIMLVFKMVGVISAAYTLFSQDLVAPGSILCIGFLILSTLFFGMNIKMSKRISKKKGKFLNKRVKYIIINYCCYFITLAIASLIVLDIIHFTAHSQSMKPMFDIVIEDPQIQFPSPPMRAYPSPPVGAHMQLPTDIYNPQIVTMNKVQSFPDFTPSMNFDDLISIALQGEGEGQSQTIISIDFLDTNGKNFFEEMPQIEMPEMPEMKNMDTLFDDLMKSFMPMIENLPEQQLPNLEMEDTDIYAVFDQIIKDTFNEQSIVEGDSEDLLSEEFEEGQLVDNLEFDEWFGADKLESGHRLLKERDGKHHKKGHKKHGKKHNKKHGKKHDKKHKKKHHGPKHHKDREMPVEEPQVFVDFPAPIPMNDNRGEHSFDVEEAFFNFTIFIASIVFFDALMASILIMRLYDIKNLIQQKEALGVQVNKPKKSKKHKKKAKKEAIIEQIRETMEEDIEAPKMIEPVIREEPAEIALNSSIESQESLIKNLPVEEATPQPQMHQVAPQLPASYPPSFQMNGQTFVPIKVSDFEKIQRFQGTPAYYFTQR
eukprot:CAMPEP_0205829178 /NCGR_PEP_ID=MMETSP0206-20130828/37243_1 /ASSEMBLY_ACC=CAM_ASM_000279 /TAXON_ID=36767 /ORGANISM="Euplotes focardii, Strain TN1" /LENGTH=641 /DNA_ID=CAMNT_0053131641 /DNA_START=43 /DNA_END=1968 /DNA_ORIENTATION=-